MHADSYTKSPKIDNDKSVAAASYAGTGFWIGGLARAERGANEIIAQLPYRAGEFAAARASI
jgi:hypothetical protein